MSHLELVALVVRDYDAAIRFFVDVLQFELVEDSPSQTNDGRAKRWVVVRPRTADERTAEDRRPATGLLLAQADGDGQRAAVGRQFAGRVGLFLRVDDFADATKGCSRQVCASSTRRAMNRMDAWWCSRIAKGIGGTCWGHDPRKRKTFNHTGSRG